MSQNIDDGLSISTGMKPKAVTKVQRKVINPDAWLEEEVGEFSYEDLFAGTGDGAPVNEATNEERAYKKSSEQSPKSEKKSSERSPTINSSTRSGSSGPSRRGRISNRSKSDDLGLHFSLNEPSLPMSQNIDDGLSISTGMKPKAVTKVQRKVINPDAWLEEEVGEISYEDLFADTCEELLSESEEEVEEVTTDRAPPRRMYRQDFRICFLNEVTNRKCHLIVPIGDEETLLTAIYYNERVKAAKVSFLPKEVLSAITAKTKKLMFQVWDTRTNDAVYDFYQGELKTLTTGALYNIIPENQKGIETLLKMLVVEEKDDEEDEDILEL
jgi:hypothetical protein